VISPFLRWFLGRPPLLVRDAEGKYVSLAGRAYRVTVEPQPGAEAAILVTLYGAPCVPNTFLNHLCVRVDARPGAIDAAIRELLSRADAAEARFAAVRVAYDWPALTVSSPEEEAARVEAATREALMGVPDVEMLEREAAIALVEADESEGPI